MIASRRSWRRGLGCQRESCDEIGASGGWDNVSEFRTCKRGLAIQTIAAGDNVRASVLVTGEKNNLLRQPHTAVLELAFFQILLSLFDGVFAAVRQVVFVQVHADVRRDISSKKSRRVSWERAQPCIHTGGAVKVPVEVFHIDGDGGTCAVS